MKISLLTPTGARHKAFYLCERWMKAQTYKGPIEWLVVDDYPSDPTPLTMGQISVKPPVIWTPDTNTQHSNMVALLERVRGDIIFIIEDDDLYSPTYIETMLKLLETSEVAGLSNNKYYHVGAGYRYMWNYQHSSLCTTAIRKSQLKRFNRAVESGQFYIDIAFWKSCKEDGVPASLLSNTKLSIGIKGMPGRAGLSRGHDKEGYIEDPDLKVFKSWLGKDWEHYKGFLK